MIEVETIREERAPREIIARDQVQETTVKKEMIERDTRTMIIEEIMKEKINKIVPLEIGENLKEGIRVGEFREISKVTVPFLNRLL
jgi:hypothetical protein